MTKKLFQEKSIIWRIKKGSIDILLITIIMIVLIIIPCFKFLISVFSTIKIIDETKQALEIASIATYAELSQESIGLGIVEIDEELAKEIFYLRIQELSAGKTILNSIRNPVISIYSYVGKIYIDTEIIVSSSFDQSLKVENSIEFIIDPLMEVS